MQFFIIQYLERKIKVSMEIIPNLQNNIECNYKACLGIISECIRYGCRSII